MGFVAALLLRDLCFDALAACGKPNRRLCILHEAVWGFANQALSGAIKVFVLHAGGGKRIAKKSITRGQGFIFTQGKASVLSAASRCP